MSGYMGSGATKRRPLDFYPTPRPVTRALGLWLEQQPGSPSHDDEFLDPAAGTGELIEGLRDCAWAGAFFHGIEIDAGRFEALELVAESPIHGDALSHVWPAAHVVANPPFGDLDLFWSLTSAHRARHAMWGAVLTPVAWWNAEKRATVTRPDYMLALGWRPAFHAKTGPAHKGSQDFVWAVLAPRPRPFCEWLRLEKPAALASDRRAA